MSLCNVWIERDRALVAVDTAVQAAPPHGHVEASKLIPIAHLGAVIAGRGQLLLITNTFLESVLMGAQTFDELVDRLPEFVRNVVGKLRAAIPDARAYRDPAFYAEVHVVGWSERLQSMQCQTIVIPNLSDPPKALLGMTGPARVAPAVTSIPPLADVDAMRALALEQIRATRASAPSEAIGGRLLLATLTPGSVAVYDAGTLSPE